MLTKDPAFWCARFADESARTLRVAGLGGRASLMALAARHPGVEAEAFSDDWTDEEVRGEPPVDFAPGPPRAALRALAGLTTPAQWILRRLSRASKVVEVGCGAAGLTRSLLAAGNQVVSLDSSLRAVLLAVHAGAQGVVGDAAALPVREADVVVAENVVDLLAAPERFLRSAAKVSPRLILTTPDPESCEHLLTRYWRVRARCDGLVWLRRNSARFVEVYTCLGFDLTRRERPVALG